jgi:hypothetical protein
VNLIYIRAQDKRRRKKEAEFALKSWIDALEETSSKGLELPGSNRIITQNQEI